MQEIVRSTRGLKNRRLKGKAKLNRKITLCIASIFCCLSFVAVGVLASMTDLNISIDNDAYYYATAFNKNANDEFIIRTYDDLVTMSNLVNSDALVPDTHIYYREAKFYLANDIDPVEEAIANGTSETDAKNATYPLSPIGKNSESAFSGEFRGDGHTISNITITLDSTAGFYGGLFGYTMGAKISGIGLGTAEDVSTDGTVTPAKLCNFNYTPESASMTMGAFGGLVGLADYRIETLENGSKKLIPTSVTECYNFSNVTLNYSGSATVYLGGLVGVSTEQTEVEIDVDNYDPARLNTWVINGSVVTDSWATILNGMYTKGYAPTVEIINCYNTGNVTLVGTSTSVYASGIACNMPNTEYTTESMSLNIITDLESNYEYAKIRYCYNLGQVSGSEGKTSAISAGFIDCILSVTSSNTYRGYQNVSRLATGVFALAGSGPESTETSTDFYKNVTYLTLDEMSGEYCFTEVAGVDTTGKMANLQNTISKEGETYSAYHETRNTDQMFKFPQLSIFEKITNKHPLSDITSKTDSYNHYGIYKTVEIDNFHNFLLDTDILNTDENVFGLDLTEAYFHSNRGGNTTTINHTTLGTAGFVNSSTQISDSCPEEDEDIELSFKIDSTVTISATPKSGFMFQGFVLIKDLADLSVSEEGFLHPLGYTMIELGGALWDWIDEDDDGNLYATELLDLSDALPLRFNKSLTYIDDEPSSISFIPNVDFYESIANWWAIYQNNVDANGDFEKFDPAWFSPVANMSSATNSDGTKTYTFGGDAPIYVRRAEDGSGYLEYNGETYYGVYALYSPQIYNISDIDTVLQSELVDSFYTSWYPYGYMLGNTQNYTFSIENNISFAWFNFVKSYALGIVEGSNTMIEKGLLAYDEDNNLLLGPNYYLTASRDSDGTEVSSIATNGYYTNRNYYGSTSVFLEDSDFGYMTDEEFISVLKGNGDLSKMFPYGVITMVGILDEYMTTTEFPDDRYTGTPGSGAEMIVNTVRFNGINYGWNSGRQALSPDDTTYIYKSTAENMWAINLVICDDGEGNPILRMLAKDGTLSEIYFDKEHNFCASYYEPATKLTLHMQVIDEAGNLVEGAVAKRDNQIAISGRGYNYLDNWIYIVGVGYDLDTSNPEKPTPPDQGYITKGQSSWTYTICADSDFVLYADEYFGYNFDGFYVFSGVNPSDLSTGYTKIGNVEYNTETVPVTDDSDPTFARSKYWCQTEAGEVHIYCRYVAASIETTIEGVIGEEDDSSSFNLASTLTGFTGMGDTFTEKFGYINVVGIRYVFKEDKSEIIEFNSVYANNYSKFNKTLVATYSKIYFTISTQPGYKVEGLYLQDGLTLTKIDDLTVTTSPWDSTLSCYVINLAKEGFNVLIGGSAVSTTCKTLYVKFAPDNPEVSVGTAYETLKDGSYGYANGEAGEGGYLNVSGKLSMTNGTTSDSVNNSLTGTTATKGLVAIPFVNSYSNGNLVSSYIFTITALTSNAGFIFKGFYGLPTTTANVDFLDSGVMNANIVKITPNSTLTDNKGVLNQLICVNNNGNIALISDGVVGETTYYYIYAVFERDIATIDSILDSGIGSSSIGGGTLSADYSEYTKTDNAISEDNSNKTQTTNPNNTDIIDLPTTITTSSPFVGLKQGSWVKIYISSVSDGYRLAGYYPTATTTDCFVGTFDLDAGTTSEGYVMYAQVGVVSNTLDSAYYTANGTIEGFLCNFVKPSTSGSESIWVEAEGKYVTVEFVNAYTQIWGNETSYIYAKFEKTPLEDFMHVGKNDYNALNSTGSADTDFEHNGDGSAHHTSTINTDSDTLNPELMGEAVVKYVGTTYTGENSLLNNAGFTYTTYNENNINYCNTFNITASVGDLLEFYAEAKFGFELVDAVALLKDGTTKVYDSSYFVETTLTSSNNTSLNNRTMYKFIGNLPDSKIRVATDCVEISEKGDFTDIVQITKFMFRFKPVDFNINFSTGNKDINGNEFIFYNEAKGEHNLGYDVIYYRGTTGGTASKVSEYTETVDGETLSYLTGFDKRVATYATEGTAGSLYQNNATGRDGNTGRGFFSARNTEDDYPSYIFVGWGIYGADGALSHAILLPQATPKDVYATALSTITERGLSHEIMDTTNFRLSALGAQSAYEALIVQNAKNGTNSACVTLQALWFPLAYNDMEGRTYLVVHSTGDVMVGDNTGAYCNAQTWDTKDSDGKYIFKTIGYDRTIPLEYGKPFILDDYWYLYNGVSNFTTPYTGYELAGFNSHFDSTDLDSVQYTWTAQIYADGKNITISDVSSTTSDSLLLSVVINGEAAKSTDVNPFTTVEEINGVSYKFIHLYAIFKKTVTYYVGTTDSSDNFLDTATDETSTLGSSFTENYYFGYENDTMREGGTQNVVAAKQKAVSYLNPLGYLYCGIILKDKLLTDGSYNALLDNVWCGSNSNLLIYDTSSTYKESYRTFPLSSEVNTEVCVMGAKATYFYILKPNADDTAVELSNMIGRTFFRYKLSSNPSINASSILTSPGWYTKSIETYHSELASKYNMEFVGWSKTRISDPTATTPAGLFTDVSNVSAGTYYGVYKTSIHTNFVAPENSGVKSITLKLQEFDEVTISSYTENASGERIFEIPTMIKINAGLMVSPEYSGSTMTAPTQYFYTSATDKCFNNANYYVYLPKVTGFTFDSNTSNLSEKEYYTFGGWIKDTSRLSRVWDSTNGVSVKWYTDVDYNSKDSDGNYLEQGQESYYVEISKENANGGATELLGSEYDFSAGSSINLYPVFKYHEVSISNDNIIQNIFTEDRTSGLRVDNFIYSFNETNNVLRIDNHKFVLHTSLSGANKYTGVYFVLTNTSTESRFVNLNFASAYSTSGGSDYTELVYYQIPSSNTMNSAKSVVEIPAGTTYEFVVQAKLENDSVSLTKFEFWPTWGTSADATTNDLFVTGGKDDLTIALTTTVNNETVPICTLDTITLEGGAEVWGNFFCLYKTGDKVTINLTNFKAKQYVFIDCGGDVGVTQSGFKCTYTIPATGTTPTGEITTNNGSDDAKGFLVSSGGSVLIELELTEDTPRMFAITAAGSSSANPLDGLFKSTYNYGAIREGENMFAIIGHRKNMTSTSGLAMYSFFYRDNIITKKSYFYGDLSTVYFTQVNEISANDPAYFDMYYNVLIYGYNYNDAETFAIYFNTTDTTNETIYFNPSDGSEPQSATYLGYIPTTTYEGGQVLSSYKLEDDSSVSKVGYMTATHSSGRAFLGWYTEPTGGKKILDSEGKFNTDAGCEAVSGYIKSDGTWFGGNISITLYPHFVPTVHKLQICTHSAQVTTVNTKDYNSGNPLGSCQYHSQGANWSSLSEIENITATNGIVTSYTVTQYDYRVYYLEGDGYYLTQNTDGTYTNKISSFETYSVTPPDRYFTGFSFIGKNGTLYTLTDSDGEFSGLISPSLLEESSEMWGDVTRVIAIYSMQSTAIIVDASTSVGSFDTIGGGKLTANSKTYTQVTFYVRQGGVSGSVYPAANCDSTPTPMFGTGTSQYLLSRPAIFETEWGLEQLFYWDGSKAYTVYKNTNTSTDPSATPTLVLQKNVKTDGGLQITDENGNWVITSAIVLYTEYRALSKSAPIVMRVPVGVGDFTISNNTYGEIIKIQLHHDYENKRYYDGISFYRYRGESRHCTWYDYYFRDNIEIYHNGETKTLKYWLTGADDTTVPGTSGDGYVTGISNDNYIEYIRYKAVTSLTEGNNINITLCLIRTNDGGWMIAIFGLPETARQSEASLRYSLTMVATNAKSGYTSIEYDYQMMFSNPAINYVKSADNAETTYFLENFAFSSVYISNTTSSMEFSTVYKSDNSAFLMKVNTEQILIDVSQGLYDDKGKLTDYRIMGYFSNLSDAVDYFNANQKAHCIRLYDDIIEKSNTPIIIDAADRTANGMLCSLYGGNGTHTITFDSDYPITIITNNTFTDAFKIYNLNIVVSSDATYSNEFIFDIKSTSTYAPERYFNFEGVNIENHKKGGGGVRADFSEQGEGYWIRFFGGSVTTDGTSVLYKGSSSRSNGGVWMQDNATITSLNSYAIYVTKTYYVDILDGAIAQSYSSTKPAVYVEDLNTSWGRVELYGGTIKSLGKIGSKVSCIEVKNSLVRVEINTALSSIDITSLISTNRGITLKGSSVLRLASFNYLTADCVDSDIYLGESSASTPIQVNALDTSATLTPITIFADQSISSFTVKTASATIRNLIKGNNLFEVSGVASITDSGSTNILYTLNALNIVIDRTLSGAPTTSDMDLSFTSIPIITFADASGNVLGQTYLLEHLKVYKLTLPLRKGSVDGTLVYATVYGTEGALESPTIITVEAYTYVKTTDADGNECYYCDINGIYLYESEDHQRVITNAYWEEYYASQTLIKIAIPSGCTKVTISVDGARDVYTSSDLTAVTGSDNTYTAQNGTIYLWWNDK